MPALIEGGRVFMQGTFGLCALFIAHHLRTESTGAFESGPFSIGVAVIGVAFLLPVLPEAIALARLFVFRLLRLGQRSRSPESPWTWDQPWDERGARSLLLGRSGEISGVLAFIMAGLAPLHLMAFSGSEKAPLPFLVILALLDVPVLFGWGLVAYRVLRALKFGSSRLAFSGFPFFLGETLDVSLLDIDRFKKARDLDVTLRCREQYLEQRGSGKSTLGFRTVWKETQRFGPEDLRFGIGEEARLAALSRKADELSRLPIRFSLPASDLSSRLTQAGDYRFWDLVVTARLEGLDYRASFGLPVYRRPEGNGPDA